MTLISVKQWMSGDPASIQPSATVEEARSLLAERGIRHLPVVDSEHRVVGILTENDLSREPRVPSASGSKRSSSAELQQVQFWMTPSPQTISAEEALSMAADRMADSRLGALPVVDEKGRLVGLLSETDLLRALAAGTAP